jgi:hypothetical protein
MRPKSNPVLAASAKSPVGIAKPIDTPTYPLES